MLCCPDTEALTFLSALFWYALQCRENTALGQENQSQICINYVMPGLGLIPSAIVCEHTDTFCLTVSHSFAQDDRQTCMQKVAHLTWSLCVYQCACLQTNVCFVFVLCICSSELYDVIGAAQLSADRAVLVCR